MVNREVGEQTGGSAFEVFRQSLEHPSVPHYSLTRPRRRSALHLQFPRGASIIRRRRPACSTRTNKQKRTRSFFIICISLDSLTKCKFLCLRSEIVPFRNDVSGNFAGACPSNMEIQFC